MSLQGTGEEWRAMDETSRPYKPDDALIARSKASIEKIRKADVELRVVDRHGKPIPNFAFSAVQKRLDFCFGEQTWGLQELRRFNEHELDRCRYQQHRFAELLNAANALCYWTERPRNDGPKTEDVQGEPQLDDFAWVVDWANSRQLTVKGHPLFWSIEKCVPEWVKRYDYETQLKFAEVRVRNLVARFKGRVKIWDAVNEPMWEPAFKNLASRHWPHLDPVPEIADYIEKVLRWCRDEDPDALFVVNDYGMEADPDNGAPVSKDGTKATAALQRKRFLALMRELTNRGTPPGALGLQSHTGGWLDHGTQVAVYDEMATSQLPIHITEFWAHTGHLKDKGLSEAAIDELQAEYVCNYLTCAFGHPAVGAFFFWGMMGSAVKCSGTRSSHDLRPLYFRLKDLLQKQWMTSVELRTDSEGRAKFRGFYGDYSLRHVLSAKTTTGAPFVVTRGSAHAPIVVEAPLAGL